MGSLAGHLVPGSIFLIIGLWWMYSTWYRYFICRQKRIRYYVSTAYPLYCCGPKVAMLPIEAFVVIFGTVLGILIELIAGFNLTTDPNTHHHSFYEGANNLQHFAMYFMFLLVGIIQLLVHYEYPLPKFTDSVAGCLAFSAEAFLFYFHGHARDLVEVQLHVFLVFSIGAIVVCGVFEMVQKENQIYASLMRAYFTTLQGTWFYTVAFFLYSPFHEHYEQSKDPDAHRTLMLIAYYFVMHLAVTLILLLVFAIIAHYASRSKSTNLDLIEYGKLLTVNPDDDDEAHALNDNTDTL